MDANENRLCGGLVISHTRRARFLCVVVMYWPHVVFGVLLNYSCPVTFGDLLVETRGIRGDAFKIQRTRLVEDVRTGSAPSIQLRSFLTTDFRAATPSGPSL